LLGHISALLVPASCVYVGSMMLAGGIAKARDFRGAWVGVLEYKIVPTPLARPLAAVLAVSEISVGTALALGVAIAIPIAVIFFGLVTTAATSALVRGLDIDCHCGAGPEALTTLTLGRNALVAVVLVAAALSSVNAYPLEPRLLNADLAAGLSIGLAATIALIVVSGARAWSSSRNLLTQPNQRRDAL